jgi:hypothetical protein
VNWGRGLFRLWLVLSALWIAVLSVVLVKDEHLFKATNKFEVEGRFKEKYEIVAPPNATETEIADFVLRNQRTDCSESKNGPWCDFPVKLQMPRKPVNPTPIYVALAVPMGALLIGCGLYWALSGFRRTM